MKMSDLKTGMIVVIRNKCKFMIVRELCGEDMLVEFGYTDYKTDGNEYARYISFSAYNEAMLYKCTDDSSSPFDISEVFSLNGEGIHFDLVYKVPPYKEVTMKEIEEKFGCRIRIVGDDGSHCLIDKDVLVEKILNTSRKGTQNFVSAYGDGCIAREDEIMQMIEELPVVLKI